MAASARLLDRRRDIFVGAPMIGANATLEDGDCAICGVDDGICEVICPVDPNISLVPQPDSIMLIKPAVIDSFIILVKRGAVAVIVCVTCDDSLCLFQNLTNYLTNILTGNSGTQHNKNTLYEKTQ